MEEKLFDPPPSAVSSRANSRAHRTKHVHISPQQGTSNLFLSSRSLNHWIQCEVKADLGHILDSCVLVHISVH